MSQFRSVVSFRHAATFLAIGVLLAALTACGAGVRPTNTAQAGAASGSKKQYSAPPAMKIDQSKSYSALIKTSMGDITVALNAKDAPLTVNNFVFLAREGFYDGLIFHRVIKGFMIQGGDPTGTGRGGPGYQFPDEPVKGKYEIGSVAMANSGANTNGSQFFICEGQQCPGLQPNYNLFGKVTSGQDVVSKIASVQTSTGDRPVQQVTILSISITES